jgi:hypothetical protein
MHTILNNVDGDISPGIFVGLWAKSRDHGGDSFVRQFKCPNLAAAFSIIHYLNGGSVVGIAASEDNKFAVTPYGDCELL